VLESLPAERVQADDAAWPQASEAATRVDFQLTDNIFAKVSARVASSGHAACAELHLPCRSRRISRTRAASACGLAQT
jgi:hypothetical protein